MWHAIKLRIFLCVFIATQTLSVVQSKNLISLLDVVSIGQHADAPARLEIGCHSTDVCFACTACVRVSVHAREGGGYVLPQTENKKRGHKQIIEKMLLIMSK